MGRRPRVVRALGWAFALLLMTGSARADVIADGTLATHYVWRGFDILGGAPAAQPSVTWTGGLSGLEATVWSSFALRDRGSEAIRSLDEVDLNLAWGRALGDFVIRGGLFHLSWFRMDDWPGGDLTTVNEVFIGVGRPDWWGMPTVTVNYEVNAAAGHDVYIIARMGREIGMAPSPPLFVGLSAGFFDADWVGPEGISGISDVNLELSTTLVHDLWAVTPRITATWAPLEEVNPDGWELWATLSVARVWPGR